MGAIPGRRLPWHHGTQGEWYVAGQVGTVRYAVCLLAPLWFFIFRFVPERFASWRGGAIAGAIGVCIAMIGHLGLTDLPRKKIVGFGGHERARPEVAALVRHLPYGDDAEIVAENILGGDILYPVDFHLLYIWDLGDDECLWVVPERALVAGIPVIVKTGDTGLLKVTAAPDQPVRLVAEGEMVRLELPGAGIRRLDHHPVLGAYLTLRSRGRIDTVVKNQPMVLRSTRITLLEQPGK
jgi:hypothetical protein